MSLPFHGSMSMMSSLSGHIYVVMLVSLRGYSISDISRRHKSPRTPGIWLLQYFAPFHTDLCRRYSCAVDMSVGTGFHNSVIWSVVVSVIVSFHCKEKFSWWGVRTMLICGSVGIRINIYTGRWWCTRLIPALGRQRQVDLCEFEASLVYKS